MWCGVGVVWCSVVVCDVVLCWVGLHLDRMGSHGVGLDRRDGMGWDGVGVDRLGSEWIT